jgi:two-component system chemotaxis response regulator CheY
MSNAILIVDDSAAMRAVTKMTLAHLGLPLLEAKNGVEALSKMQEVPTALVISDINMPGISGLELLRQMRVDGQLRHIPVVMLTTEGNQTQLEQGRKLGAKAWIVKPFTADSLIAVVQKVLGMSAH